MKNLILGFFIACVCSCISLSRGEKETLQELKSYGIQGGESECKTPAVAGLLNILPGGGNFYLAYGTDEAGQWTVGFLNLLTWPYSVVWGIPQAAIDANTINKKETIYYYKFDSEGKNALEMLKAKNK